MNIANQNNSVEERKNCICKYHYIISYNIISEVYRLQQNYILFWQLDDSLILQNRCYVHDKLTIMAYIVLTSLSYETFKCNNIRMLKKCCWLLTKCLWFFWMTRLITERISSKARPLVSMVYCCISPNINASDPRTSYYIKPSPWISTRNVLTYEISEPLIS